MNLIPAIFDANANINLHLSVDLWKNAVKRIETVIGILNENPSITLSPLDPQDTIESKFCGLEDEEDAEVLESNLRVIGNIGNFVLQLADEYIKSLQVGHLFISI